MSWTRKLSRFDLSIPNLMSIWTGGLQVYFFLYRSLRKAACSGGAADLSSPFGSPPFERPPIGAILANFAGAQGGAPRDFQAAALLASCLDVWSMETPSQFRER